MIKTEPCYSTCKGAEPTRWQATPLLAQVAIFLPVPERLMPWRNSAVARSSLLAAGAVIVLAGLGLQWRETRERRASFEALAAVLGERRFLEPRLTGGFSYADCVAVEKGDRLIRPTRCSALPSPGSEEWKDLVAALRIFRKDGEPGAAEQAYRSGIAELVIPESEAGVSRAVLKLEEAVRRMPGNARARSDLAAAYCALAQQQDEPAVLVRALNAVDEALRLAPSLPEARFNRALILDRLFLIDRAREAWEAFLDLPEGSGWKGEARRHLAALDQPSPLKLWQQRLPSLRQALRLGDRHEVREAVALSPQAARDYALEELLGEWGDLLARGHLREAADQLSAVRLLGEALHAETGEPIVLEVLHTIDQAEPESTALAALAAAHQLYRDGQREVRDQLPVAGASHLQQACGRLGRKDSPLLQWILVTLAGIDLNASRYDEALSKYQAALTASRRYGSATLAGRAQWGLGLVRLRQGRLAESLAWLLNAVSAFEAGRERENLGFALALVAENVRLLGQSAAAWRYRYRAAQSLYPYRGSVRLHTLLWEAGWTAAGEGTPRAGIDLLNEDVALGERSGQPQRLAEALLWRSKVNLAANDLPAARRDLLNAISANLRTSDDLVRQRLAIDLQYVEGEVQRRTDPAAAVKILSEAISSYSELELDLDLPGAYLARFHAEKEAGNPAQAEKDLDEALRLFERRRDTLTDAASRVSVAESVQNLYDEMLLLKAPRVDGLASLEIIERARNLAEPASSGLPLPAALASLPPERAVLAYARAGDHLFIWLLHEGRVLTYDRDLGPEGLEKSVRAFVAAIAGRLPMAEIEPRAKDLYHLLIPPAVSDLPGDIDLVIVPDKILNSLPFAALKNPVTGRYLIEERSIRMAARAIPHPARATGLGSSDSALLVSGTTFDQTLFADLRPLPGAAREVSSLAPLFRHASVLSGPEATKDRLLSELENRAIFHFAGHAIFNSQHPDHSYFVLAPEPDRADRGVLFLYEIAALRLDHLRLVVLSACRTLGPAQARTSGISGLARPFLDAGVEAVVGSLWDVDDRAAAQLLPAFHRRYLDSGDAAASLRAAELALIQSGAPFLSHPDSWAVFQVVLSN